MKFGRFAFLALLSAAALACEVDSDGITPDDPDPVPRDGGALPAFTADWSCPTPDACEPVSLAAGGLSFNAGHTCTALSGGQLVCFGSQALPEATADVTVPHAVPTSGTVADVSAGGLHTCLVRDDGTAACWGINNVGQLGIGLTSAIDDTPSAVAGLTDAVAIAAGGQHTCAVHADGSVSCWGRHDAHGALGQSSIPPESGCDSCAASPLPVPALSGVVDVAAGFQHTCALHDDGSVSCWGANDSGQLGDGSFENRPEPVTVIDLPQAEAIAAGGTATCAVTTDASVWCWGYLGEGRDDATIQAAAGCDDGEGFDCRPTPTTVEGVTGAEVAVGKEQACALGIEGTLRCWGTNRAGQVGDGTFAARTEPVDVLTNVATVAAGRLHMCAATTLGELLCWGDDEQGQLGIGRTDDWSCAGAVTRFPCSREPQAVLGFP